MNEARGDTFQDAAGSADGELFSLQPYLFLALECDRPAVGGVRYALAGIDEVVLGRGARRALRSETEGGVTKMVVTVPSRSMSGMHARLLRDQERWWLEDMSSTNGSFINGERVTRTELKDNDCIEVGHTMFILRTALPSPPRSDSILDSADGRFEHTAFCTLLPSLAGDFSSLSRAAQSNLTILLLGETGTGKEGMAQAIHELSRRPGAFVAVNCGALTPTLVESQLFGHVRGAFSGALRDETGFVRAADRGTLLLDEVGDLPEAAQPALLRVLQEQEVVPVGSTKAIKVDVRVIAATHRNLDQLCKLNRFRADLLARLDGYRFVLPALRERREDIGLLVANILERRGTTAAIAPGSGRALFAHTWPHNIRELVRELDRALVLAHSNMIAPMKGVAWEHTSSARLPSTTAIDSDAQLTEAEAELKRELVAHLDKARGNISEVARSMGKARMQIHRWMKRFGIAPGRGGGV